MKILHICLASHYTEGMTYQDNLLPEQNAADGHAVVVVSDCFKYEGARLIKTEAEDKVLASGVRLVRFPYDYVVNEFISSKVRKVKALYGFLSAEKPDVILFHGVAGYELLTVARYKSKNPLVKLYVDSHEDFHNSGTVWISRFFQYRIFNNFIVQRIRTLVDKFLYLSYESKSFLTKMYNLKDDEMEFYPLGGQVISAAQRADYSAVVRAQHALHGDDVVIVHSGKLDRNKKTEELLNAFFSIKNENLKLLIVGSIPSEQSNILMPLIERDSRIIFVGWASGEDLIKYLAAADLYFQPGTQSATMQNALCCGAPVALFPYDSHKPYLKGNGFFVRSVDDYVKVFEMVCTDPSVLVGLSEASFKVARELLDYKLLAARLYR